MTEEQALELHKRAYMAQVVTLADGTVHRLCWMGRIGRARRLVAGVTDSPHLATMRKQIEKLEEQAVAEMDAADAARNEMGELQGSLFPTAWPFPADCDCEECTANGRARDGLS